MTHIKGKPRRAVFLDRDGVLNESPIRDGMPRAPASLDELVILPGANEACEALHDGGFMLVVITNQPDVARGTLSQASVDAINQELQRELGLDEIRVCMHDDDDHCACRKPAPGMILGAAADYQLDLADSVMVGDQWQDIEAGCRAGCHTVLIEPFPGGADTTAAELVVRDLLEAVPWIRALQVRSSKREIG